MDKAFLLPKLAVIKPTASLGSPPGVGRMLEQLLFLCVWSSPSKSHLLPNIHPIKCLESHHSRLVYPGLGTKPGAQGWVSNGPFTASAWLFLLLQAWSSLLVALRPQRVELGGDTLGLSQCSRMEAGRANGRQAGLLNTLQREGLSYIRKNYFAPNTGRQNIRFIPVSLVCIYLLCFISNLRNYRPCKIGVLMGTEEQQNLNWTNLQTQTG